MLVRYGRLLVRLVLLVPRLPLALRLLQRHAPRRQWHRQRQL